MRYNKIAFRCYSLVDNLLCHIQTQQSPFNFRLIQPHLQTGIIIALLQGQRREHLKGTRYLFYFSQFSEILCCKGSANHPCNIHDAKIVHYFIFSKSGNTLANVFYRETFFIHPSASKARRLTRYSVTAIESIEADIVITIIII